ncbi:hypothetical protein OG739_36675 [Streptomyces longwoodensis]|uniref:hypothetical protein n=1 Tax=Streptomyces longwoodensis TaxID=68231 RepID=UPI00131D16F1|nr:hypothetical protein [Streptomyces longwoodensis]WRY92782.1 hypothetical protein OG481_31715 [Streptomyces longwoodensis]
MRRPQLAEAARGMTQSAVQVASRAMNRGRRVIEAADIWIQDHYWAVVISVLLVLCTGTALLLEWRWAEVTEFARQIAPVLTTVSIIASTLLSVLAWFRRRRHRRLAAQAAANSASNSGG